MITPGVIREILNGYRLPPEGVHGVAHWGRVWENGQRLAARNGADLAVVECFAVFHDCRRENEVVDPLHGRRGAELVAALGPQLGLSGHQLEELMYACANHAKGLVEGSLTIRTCWDADRLDLMRVGIRPVKALLCTAAGKGAAQRVWSELRSRQGYTPRCAREWMSLARPR